MSGFPYTTRSAPMADNALNGGLNSTSGPLGLKDNESSDLQNVEFDVFGSVTKRSGYDTANVTASLNGGADCELLTWFEFVSAAGAAQRKLVSIYGNKLYVMDDLDGLWDNDTDTVTITAANVCDSEPYLNELYMTNNTDVPFEWNSNGTACAASDIPVGLTTARCVSQFSNHLFYGNCRVSGTSHTSRIYWSNLQDTSTWTATDFIDVSKRDGQQIVALEVLGDRLVIYKERSIYNLFYTGDADIPFVLPGGGKSNSIVGCAAQHSVQKVKNGHVFLSHDGIYFYDGSNAFKLSDKISTTLLGYNKTSYSEARSLVYNSKNQYWLGLPASGTSENNRVVVWDYANNAFSIFVGMDPAYMCTVFASGTEERPYFGDYEGFTYRADFGDNDNPKEVSTAVSSYYYTNWRHYGDLISHKAVPEITLYHKIDNTTLTFAYSYDFEEGDSYTQSISLATSSDVYGVGVYGTAVYAGTGGKVVRRSLTGRGRVVRFKFENNTLDESFRIDGFGSFPNLETNAG